MSTLKERANDIAAAAKTMQKPVFDGNLDKNPRQSCRPGRPSS